METIAKGDFVELKYTGYSDKKVFDSNIAEDLKTLDEKAAPEPALIIVGKGLVLAGLDTALEGKEIGKEYRLTLTPDNAFGPRKKELVQVFPLKRFLENKITPQVGMILALDTNLAKVIAVSGARVTLDINNPLAGKEITYKFIIVRKLTDETEKVKPALKVALGFIPEDYEVSTSSVVIKGPAVLNSFIEKASKDFKSLFGKPLTLQIKELKEPETNKDEPHTN